MAVQRPPGLEPEDLQVAMTALELLTPVRPGMTWDEVLTAARVNAIQDLLRHLLSGENVAAGTGLFIRRSPDGWSVRAGRLAALGAAVLLPLQPYSATEDGTPKIGVNSGTFGSNAELNPGDAVPKIDGTRLDASPSPKLTVAVGDKLLYLKVTVNDDGRITAVTVEKTSSPDPPAPTLYTIFYVRLATLTVTSDSVSVGTYELGGSQVFELCGGTYPVWTFT